MCLPLCSYFLAYSASYSARSFFRYGLVSWLADYVLSLQHIIDSRFRSDQASDLALRELEVRTQTVINKLVSLGS
jgi:hypothetical protein